MGPNRLLLVRSENAEFRMVQPCFLGAVMFMVPSVSSLRLYKPERHHNGDMLIQLIKHQ